MSRVTAPSKLARSINSAATAGRGRFDAHTSHGAVLMPKYAELLNRKTPEVDVSEAPSSSLCLYFGVPST